ncbi:hypothetical protein H257_16605 [Aphanomyces astaci]|uniref:Uncharacterized protein n=1 Tax=Aphanomyces astaci TaxID=112090 RepID=W4FHP1_APHAT|nr:hypothetical protein H257_16605 [Aphanomyces astaci]ETV67027.1 hypothetical protein H257_16605 [Aphanomyces astaci]|eukprot:XP_009843396.1 hypothetical protein H257_16605 [Aphanomyces astaci]
MSSSIARSPPPLPKPSSFSMVCSKPLKRKRSCGDVTDCDHRPMTKKGLTAHMHASLALLQHLPALNVHRSSRLARRGAVDVGDCMIHALGSVLQSTAQLSTTNVTTQEATTTTSVAPCLPKEDSIRQPHPVSFST